MADFISDFDRLSFGTQRGPKKWAEIADPALA